MIAPFVPLLGFGETAPQLSVAVAVPRAALICAAVGLHPKSSPLPMDPVAVITGGVRSEIQLMVRDAVAVLRQPSVTTQVLVCVRAQPLLVIAPFVPLLGFGDTAPQLSLAVAVPRAASICVAVGLQPKSVLFGTDPVVVSTGGVRSEIQLIVRDAVAVLRQPSVTTQVLVCVRAQPLLVIAPFVPLLGLGDTAPQLSVAVAVPRAASI